MLPSFLTRTVARAVLLSYVTQLVAPVYAAEMTESPVSKHAQEILQEDSVSLSSYQYRLSVRPGNQGSYILDLARQLKDGNEEFQDLYRSSIQEEEVSTKVWDQDERSSDIMLSYFKRLSCSFIEKGQNNSGCRWTIPGFGSIKVSSDGTVFFDQDVRASALSSCDLILHTTGILQIQSLHAHALTLQSPRIYNNGILCVHDLKTDSEFMNEGAVQVTNLSGSGTFFNHSFVKLEDDALLNISTFKNMKGKETAQTLKIEGSKVQIQSDFQNSEDGEIEMDHLLITPAEEGKSFLNNGSIKTIETTSEAFIDNEGRWETDKITLTDKLFNNKEEGELIVRKQFTLNGMMINDGKLTTRGLAELGIVKELRADLDNYGTWTHEGNVHLGQYAEDEGSIVTLYNTDNGKIIWKNGTVSSVSKQQMSAFNRGASWVLESMTGASRMNLRNVSFFQLKDSVITMKELRNISTGKMILSPNSEVGVLTNLRNLGIFEGGRVRTYGERDYDLIENEGTMIVRGILGTGYFVNTGHLRLEGSEDHPAVIDIAEFYNGCEKAWRFKKQENPPEIVGHHIAVGENTKKIVNTKGGKILTQGRLTTQQGRLVNDGTWHHVGDLSLGKTEISNSPRGNILWEQGKWTAHSQNTYWRNHQVSFVREYPHSDERSQVSVFKREKEYSLLQQLIAYTNKGKWIFKDVKGYGGIDLQNEGEGIFNFIDKSSLWIDQFHNAPKAQMIFSPLTYFACHEQLNLGLFQVDEIYMHSAEFINGGTTNVKSFGGYGSHFRNLGQLNMIGTKDKPAGLYVHDLTNGYSEGDKTAGLIRQAYEQAGLPLLTPHFNGEYIKCAKGYCCITNRSNGQMDTRENFILTPGNSVWNHGVWNHKGDMDLEEVKLRNTGTMQFDGNVVCDKVQINNQKEGSWRIDGRLELTDSQIENYGSMFWRYLTLLFLSSNPKSRSNAIPVKNKGLWSLYSVKCDRWLKVINDGTFQLGSGTLNFSSLENNKELIFSGGCYTIQNLYNNKGTILFKGRPWVITREDLPARSSKVTYYDRNGHLQITNQFKDTGVIESSYPLKIEMPFVPYAPRLKNGLVLPPIPSLASLLRMGSFKLSTWYDMPNNYMDENEICIDYHDLSICRRKSATFVKYRFKDTLNHPDARNGFIVGLFQLPDSDASVSYSTIEDYTPQILKKLSEKGYICPPVSVSTTIPKEYSPGQPYIFNNINLLDLVIKGNFTLQHKLHVGTLKLDIKGGLIFQENKGVLASLAATDGTMTVTAHWVDAQFGQLYGAKDTKIKATKGDINVGTPKKVPHNMDKKLGCTFHYTDVVGNKWATCQYNDINGAYISSGGTLDLNASQNLDLSYSQIWSKGKADFRAEGKIEALRAIIHGNWEAYWKANHIHIGRPPQAHLHVGWMSSGYPDCWGWAGMSEQSEVHYGWTITFDTPKLKVTASTITSYKDIFIRKGWCDSSSISTKEGHQNPSSLELCNYGVTWGGPHAYNVANAYPTILARQNINVAMDNLKMSGMLNAANHIFDATQTIVFQNGSRARQTIVPTVTVVDITDFAQGLAKLGGYLKLTADGEVKPDFRGNEKYFIFEPNQAPYLVNPQRPQEFRPPLRCLNPMRFLSASMWDMLLHPIMAQFLGKAGFREDFGNSPLKTVLHLTEDWTQKMGRNHIFVEELETLPQVIFIQKCVQEGAHNLLHTYLAAPPEEVNPYQSDGDISGDNLAAKAREDLHFQNTQVVMKDTLKTHSGRNTHVTTTTTTTVHKDKGVTTITTKADPRATLKAKEIEMTGGGNLKHTGSYTEADILKEDFEGTIEEETVVESKTTITESSKNGIFNSSSSVSVDKQTSHLPPEKVVHIQYHSKSGKGIHHEGSVHRGVGRKIYEAPYVKGEAAQSQNSHYSHSESGNGFSSMETTSREEHPTMSPLLYEGEEIIFKSPFVELRGADVVALILDASAATERFYVGPAMGRASHFNEMTASSPLAESNVGQKGWTDVIRPSRFIIQKLKLATTEAAENVLDTVELPPEAIEIVGSYIEKITEPQSHFESWANHYQVVPQEAMPIVSAAIILATQGAAASLGATLCGAGTLGASVVAAGFQAVCVQAGVNLAGHGDPLRMLEYLKSEECIRSVAASMAKVALVGNGGYNASAGFVENVAANVWRSAVGVGVDAAVCRRKVTGRTFLNAAMQAGIETGVSAAAHGIGVLPEQTQTESLTKHVAQGAAAAVAKGLSNLVEGQQFEKDMGAAGFGAIVSKLIAQGLINEQEIREGIRAEAAEKGYELTLDQENDLYMAKVRQIADIARICTASLGLVTGFDPATIITAASPVLEHDFVANQQRYVEAQRHLVREIHKKKAKAEAKKKAEGAKKPNKTLKPTRRVKRDTQKKIDVDPDDLYLNMVDQQQKLPQEEYFFEAAQEAKERGARENKSTQKGESISQTTQTTTPTKPLPDKAVMITFADSFTGESTEMTWDQGVKELTQSIDIASFIPSPFGMACLAVGLSRDLYTDKTTVGEILFDTALGIGAVKAIQWTCRGIKVLYRSGKSALVHLGEKISSQFQNPFAYQQELLHQLFGVTYGGGYRRAANQNQVPFVGDLRAYGYSPEGMQYGNLMVLGEQTGFYLGHDRVLLGLDQSMQCVRQGSQNWTKTPKGALGVVVHGNEEGVYLHRMAVYAPQNNPVREFLASNPMLYRLEYALADHRLLAKIIQRDPNFNKNNLVALLSCNVGKADFAQNLANALGARVIAATEIVWPYADGSLLIAAMKDILSNPSPDFTKLGVFKLFYPGNIQAPLRPLKTPTSVVNLGGGSPHSLDALSKYIDRSKFSQKVKAKTPTWKNPKTGEYIERNSNPQGHGGCYWKLKDRFGNRLASLSEDYKILRK